MGLVGMLLARLMLGLRNGYEKAAAGILGHMSSFRRIFVKCTAGSSTLLYDGKGGPRVVWEELFLKITMQLI